MTTVLPALRKSLTLMVKLYKNNKRLLSRIHTGTFQSSSTHARIKRHHWPRLEGPMVAFHVTQEVVSAFPTELHRASYMAGLLCIPSARFSISRTTVTFRLDWITQRRDPQKGTSSQTNKPGMQSSYAYSISLRQGVVVATWRASSAVAPCLYTLSPSIYSCPEGGIYLGITRLAVASEEAFASDTRHRCGMWHRVKRAKSWRLRSGSCAQYTLLCNRLLFTKRWASITRAVQGASKCRS